MASANMVGNVFVNQYYNVLHQQPQNVHRFYTDASRVTRAEAGSDGAVDMVVNQNEIHRKIMSLDYAEFKAEIKTVDSQDSLTGGVLVMVTGSLTNKADGKRNFVQSFFLAPQEKGYYVLNDVFRYIDEEPQQVKHAVLLANGTPEPASSHTASEPEHVVHEVPATPELNEAIATHTYAASPDIGHTPPTEAAAVETVKDEEPVNQAAVDSVESLADNPLGDANDTTGSGYSSEEPKKFSYASILGLTHMRRKNDARGAPAPAAAAPAKSVQAPPIAASAVEAPAAPAPPIQPPATTASATPTQVASAAPPPPPTDDISAEEAEADSRSVFVRYLPLNVTPTDVGEAFRNFGVVKLDRVNIKGQKQPNAQNCYGFVEFEDQAGALAAIEAGHVSMGNHMVRIEKKQPLSKSIGRGGRGGRGGERMPYRNDNMRGRGPYGGRGTGRGQGDMGNFGNMNPSNRGGRGQYGRSNSFNSGYQGQGGYGDRGPTNMNTPIGQPNAGSITPTDQQPVPALPQQQPLQQQQQQQQQQPQPPPQQQQQQHPPLQQQRSDQYARGGGRQQQPRRGAGGGQGGRGSGPPPGQRPAPPAAAPTADAAE